MRALILGLSFGTLVTSSLAAEQIGQVASITPALRGSAGVLSLGAPVHTGEELSSSATGRGQLLFNDQTTLSIAPNSRITLDRFVYDPNRGAGEVALGLTRGALRFIGGKTTKTAPGTITTPSATIGVRGSSVLVLVPNAGETTTVFLAGEKLCLTHQGAEHCTNRRGGVLNNDGYQGVVTPEALSALLEQVDGTVGDMRRGAGVNTGITASAPPDRAPVSSSGEEPDETVQDKDITVATDIGTLPPVPNDEEPVDDVPCVLKRGGC